MWQYLAISGYLWLSLVDIISKYGSNQKNLKARVGKGTGIIAFFLTILEGIPFGKFYFEIAVSLRNSLLISSLMCNSEAWYNLTNTDLNLLGYKVTQEDFEST